MKKHIFIQGSAIAFLFSAAISQAAVLADYNFENATAGASLGGPVGTARTTDGVGAGFPFSNNTVVSDYTVSTLTHTGPGDMNAIGANVRSDTLALSTSGGFSGNFMEISPHRLTNTAAGDKDPATYGGDYFTFIIQAEAGYALSLNSFSYDKGAADGAGGSGTISFQSQAWYSLDSGITWTKLQEDQNLAHITNDSFSSTNSFIDLTGISELQNIGDVTIALALGDNSGRSAYSASSTNPAAFYLDNIQLAGDVAVIPEPATYAFAFGVLSLATFAWRRRLKS
ncbi:PEP-CTERM sorting domain-containing protein [Cerasicoccus arenae]|uniref:PEP-CTERM sorting domain-containing protein n=1 Tax=Cerasicoccus arenae TaxID=424488 RepID=A0A8J3GD32_9BACT|nr:PEP-CTERM sorting domain-containing protein [Cerasicoccus arenae]MBK1859712.1 hypothetical protein [Cerasicoccus arenae]GHC03683.1 hypothetical protein GCM10007047_20390 [Cerasicoccus arenae]